MKPANNPGKMRLHLARAISRSNQYSRSQAIELIREGRVRVNNRPTLDIELSVDLEKDRIAVDGCPLSFQVNHLYLAFHKPKGVITTTQLEKNAPGAATISQYFQAIPERIFPCGRLDRASEGLILMTTDPQFSNAVTSPKSQLEKEYRVTLRGVVTESQLALLETGLVLSDGTRYQPCQIQKIGEIKKTRHNPYTELQVILKEGKNHEIRRMFWHIERKVKRLIRVRIGPILLGDLPSGKYRLLSPAQVHAIIGDSSH